MLCCFAEFLKRAGVPELLEELVTPTRKSVVYSARDYCLTLVLSVAVGCDHNVAINYLLRPYPQVARLLGLRGFPEQSSVSGFLHGLHATSLEELELVKQECQRRLGAAVEADVLDVDIDATGITVHGASYQGATKGYFPRQRGKRGYQLGLVSASSSGEALADCFLPGHLRPEQLLSELLYGAAETCGGLERLGLIVLDAGFGTEANLRELQANSLSYLVKGRDPRTFQQRARALAEHEWDYVQPYCHAYELGPQRLLPRSTLFARTVLTRYGNAKGELNYHHVYTSLPASWRADEVVARYNQREAIESVNKIVKSTLHAKHLRTRTLQSIEAFVKINLLTLNLLHAFRRLILTPAGMGELGIRDIVCRLMPIPAQFTQTGDKVRLAMPALHQLTEKAAAAATVVSGFSLKR